VDIDIAIGDFNQLGRGIGTAALCRLVEKLSTETAAPLFVLFTSIRNTAAIRSYSKAGFRKLRLYDDGPYGMCWIMQWNPVERAGERPQGEQ